MERSTSAAPLRSVLEFDVSLIDMDPFFIHYTTYTNWMDRGFMQLFRTLGHPLHTIIAAGYGFPMVHCQLDFRQPAELDDHLHLTTAITRLGRSNLTVSYDFARVEADGTLTLLVHAESTHVYTRRATREAVELPAWLHAAASEPPGSH